MQPILTKEEALELKERFSTPFYIYDEKGIRENLRGLLQAFSWNKNFKEYFAVKANPNPSILKILQEEGCGMDCASFSELLLSDTLGFKGNDIFFSSNETPPIDYQYARNLSARINLDDITHIDFLNKVAGIPEEICCRYNPGNDFATNNKIMSNPSEAKYGFTFEQLTEGYRELLNRGVKKVGVHAFLASNCLSNDYYPSLARMLFEMVARMKREHGVVLSFVNLSGGIGIPYLPDEQKVDIMYIGEKIKQAYEEVLNSVGIYELDIFTELGRYVLGPFGQLVTTALHHKNIYKNYIGVDSCAVNLIRPAMYGAYHHITVLGKENDGSHVYDVVGSLCENNDRFAIDRSLPKIEDGDILVIHDAGAHGYSMGYNYNGKLKCSEILKKEDGAFQLIRRAETPMDYFATLDINDEFIQKAMSILDNFKGNHIR